MTGLSTVEALTRLHAVILAEINEEKRRRTAQNVTLIFLHRDRSPFCFVFGVVQILLAICFFVGYSQRSLQTAALYCAILLVSVALNCFISLFSNRCRRNESIDRAEKLSIQIRRLLNDKRTLRYNELEEPLSECIHLQWTYRDGRAVSLPWMLLVAGDEILLRPGHLAPATCRQLDGDGHRIFFVNEVFAPNTVNSINLRPVKPMEPIRCTIMEAPIAGYLRSTFANASNRPRPIFENELFHSIHFVLELYLLPLGLAMGWLCAIGRHFRGSAEQGEFEAIDGMYFFSIPALITLPLVGPAFVFFLYMAEKWMAASVYTRFVVCTRSVNEAAIVENTNQKSSRDRFKLIINFVRSLKGDYGNVGDFVHFVQTLGNLTSVAFVDKKGVLSWPNPSPEKLFFFKPNLNGKKTSSTSEVLDVTRLDNDGSIGFDDPNWNRFMPSLKAIAENLRQNGCGRSTTVDGKSTTVDGKSTTVDGRSTTIDGRSTTGKYNRFLDHLTTVSITVPRTIAVANRRCLCHLTRAIGFTPTMEGQSNFNCIGLYKRQPGDPPVPGLIKHRTPLENAFLSVLQDEKRPHLAHVMVQGTADLIIDACSHLWNGQTLTEIDSSARRKVADFYQRHSMTGYCLALAYRPTLSLPTSEICESFIELPLNPIPTVINRPHPAIRAVSYDPLLINELAKSEKTSTAAEVIDQHFSKLILFGMIAMQYQARIEFVRLVEQLDAACIRFVYFSKENELRSRIFAEKLGLEAGWNCHISLAEMGTIGGDEKTLLKTSTISTCDGTTRSRRDTVPSWLTRTRGSSQRPSLRPAPKFDRPQLQSLPQHSLVVKKESIGSPTSFRSQISSESDWEANPVVLNKAQLPSGIDAVRPHLELVDNVPLLVSLFTDTTPTTTARMLNIMREYGEMILVVGSSLNAHNPAIFVQANAAIAIEPSHPTACCRRSASIEGKTACSLASEIASLPAQLLIYQSQGIDLIGLIAECRRYLTGLRSACLFYLMTSSTMFFIQFIAVVLGYPIVFDASQILLLCLVQLPLLSASLLSPPLDKEDNLELISPKNVPVVARKMLKRSTLAFVVKFFPTAIFVPLFFALTLVNFPCTDTDSQCQNIRPIFMTNMTIEISDVDIARQISSIVFLLNCFLISAGFVFFRYNCWQKNPYRCRNWITGCLLILYSYWSRSLTGLINGLSMVTCSAIVVWLPIVVVMNELCKQRETRLYIRDQRRRKLAFNTKLGMNSPY